MNFKDWLSEKDFAFHRIETLVALLVSSAIMMMTIVIPFFKGYIDNPLIHAIIFGFVELIIIGYWYYNRSYFPIIKSHKASIVIAITTENNKQKTRIAVDFKNQIQRKLQDYNLDNAYEIVVLHNYLSSEMQNKINIYIQALKAKIFDSEDIKSFFKLTSRLNAKFIIYGDLILRNTENGTYCLSLDAIILHGLTDQKNGQILHKEFQNLWKREITFLEKEELTGFKTNAEHIFFTTSYMLGLATFVDNNFEQGIRIWESLELYLKETSELSGYIDKVQQLKSTSYLLLSRLLYFNGQINESLIYRNKLLAIVPNEYDKYLTEAIKYVKLKNEPELALDFVKKAEKVAKKDGTWRYSKFYLLIKLNRCQEAIATLDEILRNSFPGEVDSINQVISYNNTCLKDDCTHFQSHFIIGVLAYKKLNLPIPAYEKLEVFVKSCECKDVYKELCVRAKKYISEIDKIIGIEQNS